MVRSRGLGDNSVLIGVMPVEVRGEVFDGCICGSIGLVISSELGLIVVSLSSRIEPTD